MKIWAINNDGIVFDNGNTISDYHEEIVVNTILQISRPLMILLNAWISMKI